MHHFATNKSSKYTQSMSDIADKYRLKIVAQGQVDFMTGDFNCEITDTGAGASFEVNMASVSGTIGGKLKTENRDIKATVSGSVGINFGGGIQFDLDRGIKINAAFIFGGCIEISWRKRK